MMRFLRANSLRGVLPIWPTGNNDHLDQYPKLQIHRRVWYDDHVYIIDDVDTEAGVTMFHNKDMPEMATGVETIDTAEYRVM